MKNISFGKIESFEQGLVDPSMSHQDHRIGLIIGDENADIGLEGQSAPFVMVELEIERDHRRQAFNAANRTIYADVSVESFIVYVLYHQPHLLLHHTVTASVHTYLLQFTLPLSQIRTPFFHQPFFIVIILAGNRDWDS